MTALPVLPRFTAVAASVASLATSAAAQRPPAIPVRPLGAVAATSAVTFQQVQHLRVLSDGRVLVNDPGQRRIILLDANLANPKVVVDSAGGANMYGMNPGALIPFAGDSTLFVDRAALAFLVIDPNGNVARVMSFPPGNPATYLASPAPYGYPALSATFGVAYRVPMPRPQLPRPAQGEPEVTRRLEDSAVVVAMNLKRRSVDSLAKLSTGSTITIRMTANNTNTNTTTPVFPCSTTGP